jgi:hypothetical protein
MLTLSLSVTCAFISNSLLCYLFYRPSATYIDSFSDAVVKNVRLAFRLVLLSHVTYCCSLITIGFVYFPENSYALGLTISAFCVLLVCV